MPTSKKITQLTAYAAPVSTDVLPIVDVAGAETKKITVADLTLSTTPPATEQEVLDHTVTGKYTNPAVLKKLSEAAKQNIYEQNVIYNQDPFN